ncbi:MAG: XRE family transcriptional regulator [Planctomycetaceae bacterium]
MSCIVINNRLITVARESRGKTQKQLAGDMSITQGKLSKFENGTLPVPDSDLDALSEATKYTRDFFLQGDEVFGLGTICVFHRKRSSVPIRTLKAIQAQLNIFRMQVTRLLEGVSVEKDRPLPLMDVDKYGGPEKVAQELRRVWKLPLGPISNLTAVIERSGVVVFPVDFGTRQIDAVSQNIAGSPPVFMVSKLAPGDRLRWSLAHELGHMVMHSEPSPNMEVEANKFAAEFLTPAAEIGTSLKTLTIDRAAQLKRQWLVSMAAVIKRAADLERISQRHARTLYMQMSQNGWRMKEPIEVKQEAPTVLQDMIRVHLEDHSMSVDKLSDTVFLRDRKEFADTYGSLWRPPGGGGLKVVGA